VRLSTLEERLGAHPCPNSSEQTLRANGAFTLTAICASSGVVGVGGKQVSDTHNIKHRLSPGPTSAPPGYVYPRETQTCTHMRTWTCRWKQPKYPSADGYTNVVYAHDGEFNSITKRNTCQHTLQHGCMLSEEASHKGPHIDPKINKSIKMGSRFGTPSGWSWEDGE
jgi:hypothetical protein